MMENLLKKIEYLRIKMSEIANEKGLTHRESIAVSQELDRLLNLYEYEKMKDSERIKLE
ncbi:aspartyl-phosphate phosphatase Spo0E family protein [Oceanobacillus piezotolerans]|uniref:Aspartyl-phosphate phosphatase Spo0E family protein n=2 Tax=Oceanobacillus piezotolerans TaxID=2448030 RepID=A0A498D963_9BACI|nr:aspartyl-phosphate phosphatase Spo0E family protein [Oceanobacillus piezotolerans]